MARVWAQLPKDLRDSLARELDAQRCVEIIRHRFANDSIRALARVLAVAAKLAVQRMHALDALPREQRLLDCLDDVRWLLELLDETAHATVRARPQATPTAASAGGAVSSVPRADAPAAADADREALGQLTSLCTCMSHLCDDMRSYMESTQTERAASRRPSTTATSGTHPQCASTVTSLSFTSSSSPSSRPEHAMPLQRLSPPQPLSACAGGACAAASTPVGCHPLDAPPLRDTLAALTDAFLSCMRDPGSNGAAVYGATQVEPAGATAAPTLPCAPPVLEDMPAAAPDTFIQCNHSRHHPARNTHVG